MSPPFKRTPSSHKKELTLHNGARTTTWLIPESGRSVREVQVFHKPDAYKHLPDDQNPLIPPPHWHWYQEEYFTVTQGRFIFTLEGHQQTITPSSPQPVTIPPLARHTFKPDPTSPTPCTLIIELAISPCANSTSLEEDIGGSERFFRNLYCYLDDCETQGVKPSTPQLLLFLHEAEISLAFGGPGWVARPVSWLLGLVVGRWIGGWVLGYKGGYGEYYDERVTRRKTK